jgi:hypothetical protein
VKGGNGELIVDKIEQKKIMTKRELYVGVITGVIGNILYALIVGMIKKSEGILSFLKNIITAEIPLWYFLVVIIVAYFIVLLMINNRKSKFAFLNHTEEDYMGFKFQWVWKLNEETGHYEMDDFWPICPQCGLQLRVELYDSIEAYHCSNGHCYDLNKVLNLKRDFVHKLQRDYQQYASLIDYPGL